MIRLHKVLAIALAAGLAPVGIFAGIQKETKFEGPSEFEGKTYTMEGHLMLPRTRDGEIRLARFNSEDEYILQLTPEQVTMALECDREPMKVEAVYHDGGILEPAKFCHWYLDDTAWKMVCECNRYRTAHRLPPLQPAKGLLRTAFSHSWNMRNRYGFRHGGTQGWSGENIAMGQPDPVSVTQDWYNSSGHRANMLNAGYRYIGVGYYNGMWTQQFR